MIFDIGLPPRAYHAKYQARLSERNFTYDRYGCDYRYFRMLEQQIGQSRGGQESSA
jgi:hypothetical protein